MAVRSKLIDVAKRAGVDISTVSRVLRGEAGQRVREETRVRILESARELDYAPNELARSLRTSRTKTFGMVVPQLDNPVFSAAIRGAERSTQRHGYTLLISLREPGATDSVYQRLAQSNRVDGLLVASLDEDTELLDTLEAARVPYIVLNRRLVRAPYSIYLDSRAAAEIAVDHLVSLGHRRIAHLAGRPGGFNATERFEGYRAALARHGIAFDPKLVVTAGYTAEGGADAMRTLLRARPTAVLGATLVTAAGAMAVVHEAGLRIPEDISVIGLHDAPVAEMLYPKLTTVSMPTEKMGEIAADLLVGLAGKRRPKAVPALAPDGLVLRASTGPVTKP